MIIHFRTGTGTQFVVGQPYIDFGWPVLGEGGVAPTPPVTTPAQAGSGDNSKPRSRRQRREERWLKDREIEARRKRYDAPQRIAEKDRPPAEVVARPAPTRPATSTPQVVDALDQVAMARLAQMGMPPVAPLLSPEPAVDINALILLMADA